MLKLRKKHSDATWYLDEYDSELVDEFAEYIMNHGNFGRKNESSSKSTSVLRLFRNPIEGLKAAQRSGEFTWNVLKKHSWLKPFAWLYQICRWISRGIKSGMKVKDVKSISDKEIKEREFLEKLEVTRM